MVRLFLVYSLWMMIREIGNFIADVENDKFLFAP